MVGADVGMPTMTADRDTVHEAIVEGKDEGAGSKSASSSGAATRRESGQAGIGKDLKAAAQATV
jgi:hypothetical protein